MNEQIVNFKISSIDVLSFGFELKDEFIKYELEEPKKNREYFFDIKIQNNYMLPENFIQMEVNVNIFLDVQRTIKLGNILISNLFEVENLSSYYSEYEDTMKFPENFILGLISLSVTHTRAVLITKTAGTFLENVMIPALSVEDHKKLLSRITKHQPA
ncbi:MAG: hypothetical protein K1X86_02490 [Ignavibacteria bacterium]|nr:hypothetical protein [Ignavibacteria bacterium]